jgi:Trp operon repressor
MSRKPDDFADAYSELQIDEVDFVDVGRQLVELGEQLIAVGRLVDNPERRANFSTAYEHNADEIVEKLESEEAEAFRSTLKGLRSFRRDYARWERIIVEYALTQKNYTQRDTAKLLGVGVSTINRWAQNPLRTEDLT